MARLHVEVTQEDIERGDYDNLSCPIAQALLRTLHLKHGEISVGLDSCGYHSDTRVVWRADLPLIAQEFVDQFDRTVYDSRRPGPISFDLEIPDEAL